LYQRFEARAPMLKILDCLGVSIARERFKVFNAPRREIV
jgi:hypothetical protein